MILIENLKIKVEAFEREYPMLIAKKSDVILIKGKNGSGKSLLLKTICGLVTPEKGRVLLNDINTQNENWKKFTGIFLDNNFLIPYVGFP